MDEEGFTLLEQVQTVVKINVGGSKFTTSRQTLLKDPHSLLAKMFTGDEMLQKDDEGCYFIDRDPKHFQTILTFLRDGRCVLPSQKTAVLELLQEATHFQLGGLVSLITRPSATRDADLSNFGSHLRAMVLEHRSNSGHVGESVGAVFDLMAKRLVPRIPVWEDDISLPLHVYWLYDTGSSGSPSLIAFRFKGVGNECDAGLLLSADRPGFSDWDRMWSIYSNPDDTATLSMLAKNQGVLLSIVDSKKKFFKGDDVDEVWKKTRARSLTLRIVIPSVASTQLGSIKSHNIHTPPTLYPINGSAAPAVPGEANGRSMFD